MRIPRNTGKLSPTKGAADSLFKRPMLSGTPWIVVNWFMDKFPDVEGVCNEGPLEDLYAAFLPYALALVEVGL